MLRTWLIRLLGGSGLSASESDASRTRNRGRDEPLEQRLDAIDARLDYLWHSLRKLRGRVTGGERQDIADPARDGSDGGPVNDAPPVADIRDKQWELAKLARVRQEEQGRLIKGGT